MISSARCVWGAWDDFPSWRIEKCDSRVLRTGVGSEVLAESQTPNAEKVLMQSMAIAPGASLKPAGDSHETVIITLTDGLTIAGEAVDARTVVYRPSDEDFSVENTGDEPAYYISFEYYR